MKNRPKCLIDTSKSLTEKWSLQETFTFSNFVQSSKIITYHGLILKVSWIRLLGLNMYLSILTNVRLPKSVGWKLHPCDIVIITGVPKSII